MDQDSTQVHPEVQIVAVLRQYGTLMDDNRLDEWLSLFTDDAICGSGHSTYEGKPEIAGWIRQKSSFGLHAMATPNLHFSHDGSHVTAVTPFAHVMKRPDRSGSLERAGRYFTRLQRLGDTWKIVEHIIDFHVHE